MNRTGPIEWNTVQRSNTINFSAHTYIYAYWLADTEHGRIPDAGLGILKPVGGHPDWFVHASHADKHLSAFSGIGIARVSQSYFDVFTHDRISQPLLASMLLGTADFVVEGWFCGREHLTSGGRNLLRKMDGVYLRPGILVTFQQTPADESFGPRGGHDPATV